MLFVDIHTHKIDESKNIQVLSRFIQDIKVSDKVAIPYSTGIHPWSINDINTEEQFKVLSYAAHQDIVCAIGECGIDRSISCAPEKQISVFTQQAHIANQVQKPLIIHNVRAFSDFLMLAKKLGIQTPWIFHAFTGNLRIAKDLIKQGAYLSFGHHIFLDNSKAQEVFKEIPIEHIFLETDDWDGNIEQVYIRAAELRSMKLSELTKQIYNNYRRVFC